MAADKFEVGLVQMYCTPEPKMNLERAGGARARGGALRRSGDLLPELFRTQYFCQGEDTALFDMAEPIPGPSRRAFPAWPAILDVAIVASLFERRAPGLYHNTAVVFERTVSPVSTARCISPTIRFLSRSIYFTPGDLGFRSFNLAERSDPAGLLGSVVSRGCPPDRSTGSKHPLLSHGHRLASCGKRGMGGGAIDAWCTIQRAHAIANGVLRDSSQSHRS